MKKLICLLFGHKYTFVNDDLGICNRCRREFTLDMYSYEPEVLRKNPPALRDILKYTAHKLYSSCPYCNRIKFILGIRLKKRHAVCPPF